MKETYTIGELVKELKINKETIRYYEKLGLLSNPNRELNGYRRYSKEDVENLRFIFIVKKFGFSLKEINALIHDEILCGDIKSIKEIVEIKLFEIHSKMVELEKRKDLLEKVNKKILESNLECCDDIDTYFKK